MNNEKYKITVEFYISAEDISDAEQKIAELIQEGIMSMIDREDSDRTFCEFDITDSEPEEIY